jgi:type I restriction enzyme S subunit
MSAQVRLGYKLTEVGVIPEQWEVCPVRQKGEVITGKALAVNAPGAKRPYLRTKNVFDGRIDIDDVLTMPMTDEQFAQFQIKKGDVLLNEGQSLELVGRCAIYQDEYPEPCAIQNALLRFRARAGVSAKFASYLFRYCQQTGVFARIALQTTSVAHLGGSRFERLCLAWPTEVEQHAIATALFDIDALISGLDQLIAKKRDIKQAAMQQLLTGKQRLPGFSSSTQLLKNTQIGRIPVDWEIARLGDLVDPSRSIRYGIVQPGRYDPQGRYMLRGQDYSEAKGWANPSEVFRVSPAVEERYRNARLQSGDLIMTIVGYCGHVEIIPDWLDGANLTQTTVRIAIEPTKAISAYCKYVLLSSAGKNQVSAYMKGAAQPGLNCGDIEQFFLPMPTISEQAAIATILSDMDSELVVLETRRDKARQLKQGMMQELLAGKIRIS